MSRRSGFFESAPGERSMGRLLAFVCASASILCFAAAIIWIWRGPIALKAGAILAGLAVTFYTGGKGLDAVKGILSVLGVR